MTERMSYDCLFDSRHTRCNTAGCVCACHLTEGAGTDD